MRILYTSLFPEFNNCNEVENLQHFINSAKYYEIDHLFTYRLFSCHKEMCQRLKTEFECIDNTSEHLFNFKDAKFHVEQLFFDLVYKQNMNEKRAHEIAWAKMKIHTYLDFKQIEDSFDYIIYNDSDIRLDSCDIKEVCKFLTKWNKTDKKYFANIPYILKDKNVVVDDSFGSFVIPTSVLPLLKNIIPNIYQTYEQNDIIYRKYAPDWFIRQELLNRNCSEIRAESCNTKHYINSNNYLEYESRIVNIY